MSEISEVLGTTRVRLMRQEPFAFGTAVQGPVSPYLLGALLGDGYLRGGTPQWCNEDSDMRQLLQAELTGAMVLGPMKTGQAGTGSSYITGTGTRNVLADELRSLGINDKRAWEKFIPDVYLRASLNDRLALLQGLMDTDGSIDKLGRIEFSSSSQELTEGVLELVHGLGGRARYTVKKGVMFTSPRQTQPKPARDAHRLTNVRLPDSLCPFRRPVKAARMAYGRRAAQWNVNATSVAPAASSFEVITTALDGLWIGEHGSRFGAMTILPTTQDRAA